MPSRVIRVSADAINALRGQIEQIQDDLGVSAAFPQAVADEARASAAAVRLPDLDLTDLQLVTIDPPTSMDLDQAMYLERLGTGYRVHYAIADVGAFVTPGGALEAETRSRGETLYGADSKIPLHPKSLSEGAASLLPDQVRPAIVWQLDLDGTGALMATDVRRARVRSTAKLSYEQVQASLDSGEDRFALLREIGILRQQAEVARGGVSLPMPEQVVTTAADHWGLEFRQPLPVELWNAQISLLTGIAAAQLMLGAKVGLLRTLPKAEQRALDRLRHTAKALRVPWPGAMGYPEFVRSLDPDNPKHAAMVVACTTLLRGAGYAWFDGALPENSEHAAIAAPYAHVTAPLRRLADRYALEVCVAVKAGQPVPEWVRTGSVDVPELMKQSSRRARTYENAIVDLVEAQMLSDQVGETFTGVVLGLDAEDAHTGQIQIADPAIESVVGSPKPLPVGEEIEVRLVTADPQTRKVWFETTG